MLFSSIIYAAFGLTTLVSALPAAAPVARSDIVARDTLPETLPELAPRTVSVDVQADVQVCIDAVVAINTKYAKQKYSSSVFSQWQIEVIAQIKLLINVISAYPSGCSYPSIDICVNVFVKLFVAIFVQLKLFINLQGLLVTLLLTVDVLLSVLLGSCGDLLNILVSLYVLIEAKIYVGITAKITVALKALVDVLYLQAFVKLCVKAGLNISL